MATFESREIICEMLRNEGVYPGDPQDAIIYQYQGLSGENLFAVFWNTIFDDMWSSPYVTNPVVLWDKHTGLTYAGRSVLEDSS